MLARSLRPGELVHELIAKGTSDRRDGLLPEEVGPDGQLRAAVEVRNGARKPFLRERTVFAHRLEPGDRLALDFSSRVGIAKIAALPSAREQAIGRIGDQHVRAFAA